MTQTLTKRVQSFVNFVDYNQKFIKNYLKKAAPASFCLVSVLIK